MTAVLRGMASVDTTRPRPHSTGSAPIRTVPPLPFAQNVARVGRLDDETLESTAVRGGRHT
jgi:hypothetical protein